MRPSNKETPQTGHGPEGMGGKNQRWQCGKVYEAGERGPGTPGSSPFQHVGLGGAGKNF
jgi:hypothetical protein